MSDGKLTKLTSSEGLSNDYVRAMMQSKDGTLWIGTDGGADHITGRRIENYEARSDRGSVMALLEDRDGSIWLGSFRGLAHLHNGKLLADPATKALEQQTIWSLHLDPDGGVWIGTSHGLYRYEDGKVSHLTTAQGLADNHIYQILENTHGEFWLSAPTGVLRVMRSQLDAACDGHGKRIETTFLARSSELDGAQLFGTIQPAGLITAQGDVWFPSDKGAVHINPETAPSIEPFPLVIQHVSVDGKEIPSEPYIRLRAGNSRLEISYAPISVSSQENILFRYRLAEFDKDWHNVGSRRTAYYTNLPPGKYAFSVAALEADSHQVISEASLTVVQAAHFYRSAWFYLALVLFLALLLWAIYQLRISHARAKFHAVLAERSRVAREMHDTVIQGCSTVSALLEASRSIEEEDKESPSALDAYARQQIQTTVAEARAAIWNLHYGDLQGDRFPQSMEQIATEVSAEFSIPVTLETDGLPFSVDHGVAHELLMAAREAIHNAVKHAQPTQVRVGIIFDDGGLSLGVVDNGNGFDGVNVGNVSGDHYGIKGMYQRMERIGATLEIQTAPGKGTSLLIKVPRTLCASKPHVKRSK
jgi:signal transduction histidine kinase